MKNVAKLIVQALLTMLQGWVFMLAISVIHKYWIDALPTIGYLWAVVVVATFKSAFANPSIDTK